MAKGRDAKQDLLTFMMQAQDHSTASTISADEISAESIFLILAGSDTTSTTLAATFFYLAHNEEAYTKVAHEIRKAFDSVEDIRTSHALQSCRYLHACIQEILRMNPPVGWPMWREIESGGLPLQGKLLPAGYDIGISMYCLLYTSDAADE